jgi:hypothetical protein
MTAHSQLLPKHPVAILKAANDKTAKNQSADEKN